MMVTHFIYQKVEMYMDLLLKKKDEKQRKQKSLLFNKCEKL